MYIYINLILILFDINIVLLDYMLFADYILFSFFYKVYMHRCY